jgi:hypothetical protein
LPGVGTRLNIWGVGAGVGTAQTAFCDGAENQKEKEREFNNNKH